MPEAKSISVPEAKTPDSTQSGGALWLVGTPIGNLGDFTSRARQALETADAIAAEDTRRTRKLLTAEAIATPRQFFSYRAENEARASQRILALLQTGQKVALVSDAGMPTISDPGSRVLREAVAAGYSVEVIPGVSAVTTAVALSGFGGKGFVFAGFAPQRKARIARMLAPHQDFAGALVVFESPRRLARTLSVAAETLGGNRSALVAFEMTKLHQRVWRGTLAELSLRAAQAQENTKARSKAGSKSRSKTHSKAHSKAVAKNNTENKQDDATSGEQNHDDLTLGEATLVIAPAEDGHGTID